MKKLNKVLLIILAGLLLLTAILFVFGETGVGRDFDWRLLSI